MIGSGPLVLLADDRPFFERVVGRRPQTETSLQPAGRARGWRHAIPGQIA